MVQAAKKLATAGRNGHEATEVRIPTLDVRTFEIELRGTAPIIVHKFSDKARRQIEDKQQQKAKTGKQKRDPKAEYLAAFYLMPGSPAAETKGARYGVPAAGFKKAAVKACRYIDGVTMTFANGAFHVLEDAGGLVELRHKAPPHMREDTVRLASGVLDLRYRPEFTDWGVTLRIRYNASVMSPEQIVNLFHHAGFHVGWGELRPEKGYSNGTWDVVTV
jgi:hypothetical protein